MKDAISYRGMQRMTRKPPLTRHDWFSLAVIAGLVLWAAVI